MAIGFFSREISYRISRPRKTISWIKKVALLEGKSISSLSVIFCTDEYLLTLNQQYLQHDTFTDVITFHYSEDASIIDGEIFISIDRVRENAGALEISFDEELLRVIIHGVLHLIGYSDKTRTQAAEMRKKEDAYLSLHSGSGFT